MHAFPPFSAIAACLDKIEQDQVTGVLLVPIWQTQPWFIILLHLLVDNPAPLPQSNQLLIQPHNHALHPLRKQLRLMACKLSICDKGLDLLVSPQDKGLTYTTINTARSAISAVAVPKNNMTIGNHSLVSIFMKGVCKGSPPTPRYRSTWDVQPVLSYLSSLNPPEKLDSLSSWSC